MTPQDRAEAFIGRLVKAIHMPRLPNPVHKMPQGTGLGKLSNHPMGAIARGRQEAVNARATMDSRSTGQGAEPDDYARPLKGRDVTGVEYWQKVANERATRDVGRKATKAIRMPRLPNPVHKMPQGTGTGPIPDRAMGDISKERQNLANSQATVNRGTAHVDTSGGQVGDLLRRRSLQFSKNPKRRFPEY